MKRIISLLVLTLFCAVMADSFAHDVPVHMQITKSAVNSSTGFAQYLRDANFPPSTLYPYPYGAVGAQGNIVPGATGTALAQVVNGSAREDDNGVDDGGGRSLNHFYDPTTKKGLGGALPGNPSVEWATIRNDVNGDVVKGGVNYYAWQNARDYQLYSISSGYLTNRNYQAARMFRALGQVVHLLEDTTQPQHVRNEAHLDQNPITGNDTKYRSKFEDYGVRKLFVMGQSGYFANQNLNWITAGFTSVSNFFDRNLYSAKSFKPLDANESGGPTLGLAEWVNGNFLTVRGSYAEFPKGATNGGKVYPYPSIFSTDFRTIQANPSLYAVPVALPHSQILYRCILKKNSEGVQVPMHCAVDLLDTLKPAVFGALPTLTAVHPDDPAVMTSYFSLLLPKAIAYSSGLLDYYFRGRLAITNVFWTNSGTIRFTAQNVSTQAFHGGNFYVYMDDSTSYRNIATDLTTSYDPVQGLPPKGTITGSFTIPNVAPATASNNFTLFYHGTIGVDGKGNALDPVDDGTALAVITTNVPAQMIFDLSWDQVGEEVDMYLTDPGGVTLYEADLAPANGNTNSDYCTMVGGDDENVNGTQHMVVSDMKDGKYQLWINFEGGANPVHCTLITRNGVTGATLDTETFTLTTAGSGQYGHHGWPLGVTGPKTLPSWYVRKPVTIQNGNIADY